MTSRILLATVSALALSTAAMAADPAVNPPDAQTATEEMNQATPQMEPEGQSQNDPAVSPPDAQTATEEMNQVTPQMEPDDADKTAQNDSGGDAVKQEGEKTQVKPGEGPTEAVGEQVEGADKEEAARKASEEAGHQQPTESVGEAKPDMKAEDKMDDNKK